MSTQGFTKYLVLSRIADMTSGTTAAVTLVVDKDCIRLINAAPAVLADLMRLAGNDTWRISVRDGAVVVTTMTNSATPSEDAP